MFTFVIRKYEKCKVSITCLFGSWDGPAFWLQVFHLNSYSQKYILSSCYNPKRSSVFSDLVSIGTQDPDSKSVMRGCVNGKLDELL